MNLTAKAQYACLAMLELAAQHGENHPVSIREITSRHDVPQPFLVQILLQLKRAGLITSSRGASGGYRLRHPPEMISLAQVLEATEGSSEENHHFQPESPATRVLARTWRQVARVEHELLDNISLAKLIEEIQGQEANMYYI